MLNTEEAAAAATLRSWITTEINARRRAVMCVIDTLPYAYTVGNSADGLPEFLLFGVGDPQQARQILNLLSIEARPHKGLIKDGCLRRPGSMRQSLKLIDCGEAAKQFTPAILDFYGPRWVHRVMQVLLPDGAGRYPDDPACADPYNRVPVLR